MNTDSNFPVWSRVKLTSARFIQLPFAKPQLGPVDGAGVELQSEYGVSVSTLGSPVVAFDLQRAAESEGKDAG